MKYPYHTFDGKVKSPNFYHGFLTGYDDMSDGFMPNVDYVSGFETTTMSHKNRNFFATMKKILFRVKKFLTFRYR